MSVTLGQIVSVAIEKPAAGGAMIARVDGQVVLVSGAIPGERVRARIVRTGKGVAHAETLDVQDPSPDRQPPFVEPSCGGCLYSFIRYERQLAIKAEVIADAFARIGHITLSGPCLVRPSPGAGYRMRARLHVRGGRVGFFREGSHELCDVGPTRQLLPATVEVVDRLAAAIRSVRLEAVREIELSENLDGSGRAIALVAAAPVPASVAAAIGATDGLSGALLATERSPMPSTIAGSAYVTDLLRIEGTDVRLRRHVLSFFQGNRYLLQPLVERVLGALEPEGELVDFYAGAGLFAIAAAAVRGSRVAAVEGDRFSAADLAANAAGTSVRVFHQPVETFTATGLRDATAIVDPPRTGMSREALAAALAVGARRLVYVSCDVATLARDSRKIIEAGYELKEADAFDLFPNTPHVETVVVFERLR